MSNLTLTAQMVSERVCYSPEAAQYYLPGALFSTAIGRSAPVCAVANPTLGQCGAASLAQKTDSTGTAYVGVILGNDVMQEHGDRAQPAHFR